MEKVIRTLKKLALLRQISLISSVCRYNPFYSHFLIQKKILIFEITNIHNIKFRVKSEKDSDYHYPS